MYSRAEDNNYFVMSFSDSTSELYVKKQTFKQLSINAINAQAVSRIKTELPFLNNQLSLYKSTVDTAEHKQNINYLYHLIAQDLTPIDRAEIASMVKDTLYQTCTEISRRKHYFSCLNDVDMQIIKNARQFIERYFLRKISLNDICQYVFTNEYKFKKTDKDAYGETVFDTIRQLKLTHAAELVSQNKYTLDEILQICNYSSYPSFYKAFKAHYKIAHSAAFDTIYELKIKLVEHLNQIPIGYFNGLTLGEIDTIIMTDTERIEAFIAHHFSNFIETLFMLPLITIFLFTIDPLMALLAIVPMLLAIVILDVLMNRPGNKADQVEMRTCHGNMQSEIIEMIEGMNDIKCYDLGSEAMLNYKNSIQSLAAIILKITNIFGTSVSIYYALLGASTLAVFPIFIYQYLTSPAPYELLTHFAAIVMIPPFYKEYLEKLFDMQESIQKINEGTARIDQILAIETII